LIAQHVATQRHQASAKTREETQKEEETASKSDFHFQLCRAMVAANIPFATLNNPTWKSFLSEHMKRDIPDESTIRKNYLDKVYKETIRHIQNEIGDDCIWAAVDETTDVTGRKMANFIVGKMSSTSNGKSYLLCSKKLDNTNSDTVARFVNECILSLWPSGSGADRLLLLVTDAAPYMVKAGKHLKVFYPNLIHLTCIAHAAQLVAEKVREQFSLVDKFIATATRVFF